MAEGGAGGQEGGAGDAPDHSPAKEGQHHGQHANTTGNTDGGGCQRAVKKVGFILVGQTGDSLELYNTAL